MRGVNGQTGKHLEGLAHLRQSVTDILTTPIGTRVMRRDYGSRVFELVDRPVNRALPIELYQAVGEALSRWEPRLRVERIQMASAVEGRIELAIDGRYLPDGKEIRLEGIVV